MITRIGANGYTDLDLGLIFKLKKLKRSELITSYDRLINNTIKLNRILLELPADQQELIGEQIRAAGEQLNNLVGALGVALDNQVEGATNGNS